MEPKGHVVMNAGGQYEPEHRTFDFSLDSLDLGNPNRGIYLQSIRQTPRLCAPNPVCIPSTDGRDGLVDVERPFGPPALFEKSGAAGCFIECLIDPQL